jgi:hypothetical protein
MGTGGGFLVRLHFSFFSLALQFLEDVQQGQYSRRKQCSRIRMEAESSAAGSEYKSGSSQTGSGWKGLQ